MQHFLTYIQDLILNWPGSSELFYVLYKLLYILPLKFTYFLYATFMYITFAGNQAKDAILDGEAT